MILTNSSAAKIGASNVSAMASSTEAFRHFMVYSATTISSVISGIIGLIKNGTGALTLSGNNTYTGATIINAGTFKNGSATAFSSGSALTLNGGIFDLNGFNANVASMGVGNSAGTITNSAAESGTNTITILNYNAAVASLITDGSTAKTAVTINNNGGPYAISNANNTFSGGFTIAYGGSGGGSRLYQGSITSTIVGGVLTKSNIGIGTLTIGANGSTASAQLMLNSGSIYNNIIVNAAQYADGGLAAFRLDGTGIQFFGTITAGSANINISSQFTGSATLNGQLTGTNGLLLKTPSGAGATFTLTLLNASNNYLGNTTIASRTTIVISGAGQLGSGNYSGSIANTGSFIYSSTANQILSGTITGTGQWIKNATSTLTLSGTFSGTTGPITVNAGTLALGANQTLPAIAGAGNIDIGIYNLLIATGTTNTFSGVISGSGTFRKTGSGMQTLSGNLTYTGSTQISIGTLQIIRAFGSITPTASFGASTLAVSFTGTFSSGTTDFRFFAGTTINSYASVTLTGVPVGTTATYNSANSTLSVIVP